MQIPKKKIPKLGRLGGKLINNLYNTLKYWKYPYNYLSREFS